MPPSRRSASLSLRFFRLHTADARALDCWSMSRQMRLALTLATGVLALVVIVFSVVQLNRYDHQQTAAAKVPAPLAIGTALQRPLSVPTMQLIDAQAKPFSTTQWRGKWVVLAPSMTLCHEVCPMTTAALDEIVQQLRQQHLGGQVDVAEVTVDPWRDTPARLRAYARLSGASFQQLTGTQAEIKRIWKFFGVYYARVPQHKPPDTDWMTGKPETFDVDHTDAVFLIDPAGQERILDEGMPDIGGNAAREPAQAAEPGGDPQPCPSAVPVDAEGDRRGSLLPDEPQPPGGRAGAGQAAVGRGRGAGAVGLPAPARRAAPALLDAPAVESIAGPRAAGAEGVPGGDQSRGPRGAGRAARSSRCSRWPRPGTGARSRSSATTPTTPPATRSSSCRSTRSAIRAIRGARPR